MRALFAILFLSSLLSGCASRTPREIMEERNSGARPRAASYGADGFYNDGEFSQRKPAKGSEFFFKHCDLVGHHPYPSASDWECSEPQ